MDIQISQIIFQIINFTIILVILKKLIYKPILNILDNRAAKIKEGLDAAEKNIDLQDELEQEKTKLLQDANKKSQEIIKEAKLEANQIVSQAQLDAKKQAKQIVSKEKQAFESIKAKQAKDLEQNLAAAVIKATESVIQGLVDKKVQSDLVKKQIDSLKLA